MANPNESFRDDGSESGTAASEGNARSNNGTTTSQDNVTKLVSIEQFLDTIEEVSVRISEDVVNRFGHDLAQVNRVVLKSLNRFYAERAPNNDLPLPPTAYNPNSMIMRYNWPEPGRDFRGPAEENAKTRESWRDRYLKLTEFEAAVTKAKSTVRARPPSDNPWDSNKWKKLGPYWKHHEIYMAALKAGNKILIREPSISTKSYMEGYNRKPDGVFVKYLNYVDELGVGTTCRGTGGDGWEDILEDSEHEDSEDDATVKKPRGKKSKATSKKGKDQDLVPGGNGGDDDAENADAAVKKSRGKKSKATSKKDKERDLNSGGEDDGDDDADNADAAVKKSQGKKSKATSKKGKGRDLNSDGEDGGDDDADNADAAVEKSRGKKSKATSKKDKERDLNSGSEDDGSQIGSKKRGRKVSEAGPSKRGPNKKQRKPA